MTQNANEDTAMNILWIVTDQHRADMLGCAGHLLVKTPHIDRLIRPAVFGTGKGAG